MKLPYVILKDIGSGAKVGDVVDASTFRNFKALVDQGFMRAATPEEVRGWQKTHPSPAGAPPTDEIKSAAKQFEGWGVPLKELGAGGQGKVYQVRRPEATARRRKLAERIALCVKKASSERPERHGELWATKLASALQAWPGTEADGLGALKEFQMPPSGPERDKAIGRLEAEIKALQKLTHPAVIRLLDANVKQGFIVTEYHPGGTLAEVLERSPEQFKGNLLATLSAVRPLAEALVAIHEASAVHRDIKPENVFVQEHGLVLGDFGIVIFQDAAGERLTETFERRPKGSRDWMAPWAYLGKRIALEEIDGTFDVFSLGKVVWVMLAGDPILPLWYFDRDDFNLEKRFPDDPQMRLANALLSRCVVEHKKDCVSSKELLRLIDETLAVVKADADVLDATTRRPCRVCGKGKYEAEEQLGSLNLSGKPLLAMTFICDACGHVQMFKAPGKKLGPAWRS